MGLGRPRLWRSFPNDLARRVSHFRPDWSQASTSIAAAAYPTVMAAGSKVVFVASERLWKALPASPNKVCPEEYLCCRLSSAIITFRNWSSTCKRAALNPPYFS
ncbi:hypothetical protein CALVIDRAFT_183568 [Calocera viscosa TUFC12733]|uniref:Uncharacterized protein n=1 Tax=Calocera viscosa (strain TUFC12733) TaxID=1330018 RepID=A0A167L2E7_CALVF|nr:hypothetical protein CALVIDRAFT_183568 [Calocera viscosa TUFC12733]